MKILLTLLLSSLFYNLGYSQKQFNIMAGYNKGFYKADDYKILTANGLRFNANYFLEPDVTTAYVNLDILYERRNNFLKFDSHGGYPTHYNYAFKQDNLIGGNRFWYAYYK